MRVQDLLARVPGAVASVAPALALTGVAYDSRAVTPGGVFVAIRGLKDDGNAYVDAALKKGAALIVSEQPARPGVAWLTVPDAREALASAAAVFHHDPARALTLVGVTGTNGKTTTTFLIEAVLEAAGHRVGLLGTIAYRIAGRTVDAVRTTPESSDLQALFRQMVAAGCSHAVLEVSSHSLALNACTAANSPSACSRI
jgi:UDP-N-acetylmuramoyl-L-alanyl-D-glutamate--2,6-diaminopimelate ligase